MEQDWKERLEEGRQEFLKHMDSSDRWGGCTSFAVVHPTFTFMCPETNCFASIGPHYNKYTKHTKGGHKNGPGSIAIVVGIELGYADDYDENEENGLPEGYFFDNYDRLRGPNGRYAKNPNSAVAKGRKGRGINPDNIRFLDWVLNRSPWSSVFIDKDAEACLKARSVLMDADHPGNLLIGGGVAVRRLWETISFKKHWLDLTEVGVHEHLAYFLAMAHQNRQGDVSWGASEAGHMNLAVQSMSLTDLLGFMNNKPVTLTKTYKEAQCYNGYSYMFCKETGRHAAMQGTGAQDWIKDNFPWEDGPVVPKKDAPVNPFGAAKVAMSYRTHNSLTISYDKGVARWADFQHVLFKEIGYE